MRDKSCEEVIDAHLKSRLEDLEALFVLAENDEYEPLDEFPLSVEIERKVRIVISTGGPHDEFVATLDADGDVYDVEYVYKDWFDGASRRVSDPVAERFVEYFAELVK